jgi:DNA-binding NarL/FixJ family response regulator
MSQIRVVLADDHSVLRAGLRSLLSNEPDLEVVGEAGDGIGCVDIVLEHEPDVVVLDINMPRCGGLEALPAVLEACPQTRVLVLTMHDDPAYLKQVLRSGGSGYLLKQSAADELLTAIRAVAAGGLYVHPQHARVILEQAAAENEARSSGDDRQQRFDSLSDRESQIFEFTARGHSNSEIAARLELSVKTVETYKARMMRKLGLEGRAALVRMALELGVLQ